MCKVLSLDLPRETMKSKVMLRIPEAVSCLLIIRTLLDIFNSLRQLYYSPDLLCLKIKLFKKYFRI